VSTNYLRLKFFKEYYSTLEAIFTVCYVLKVAKFPNPNLHLLWMIRVPCIFRNTKTINYTTISPRNPDVARNGKKGARARGGFGPEESVDAGG